MKLKTVLKIIDEEQTSYNYGGGEDEHGDLEIGPVDFDRIREAVKKLGEQNETN